MKFKFHITTEMQRRWDKQNFGPIFKEKLDNFLASDEELRFSNTCGPLYGKYKLVRYNGISSRPTFIWEPVVRGNVTLYVLRAAYVHDDYVKEVSVPMESGWIEKHQISATEWDEINAVLKDIISEDDTLEKRDLSPLTSSEYGFISSPLRINHDLFEETVYETEEWVDYIKSDKDFSDYYNTADRIENFIFDNLDKPNGWQQIDIKDKTIFIYHDDKNWILSDIKKSYEQDTFEELMNRPKPTVFRRGYPYTFLEDKDGWRDMELDTKSNMVLSEEQVNIVANDITYPLFITGRAGSGKSTALQYLFAEIILRYTQHKTNSEEGGSILPPVYLSYSENLISDAKNLSATLLRKNNKYKKAISDLGLSEEDILSDFDSMFYVFQDLVKQCIRVNDKDFLKEHFLAAKHVSFAKFNKMWTQRFSRKKDAAKKYGPSESWHVIRTYIKGWNSEQIMTPEAYKLIPRSDKTVSENMFETIFDNVWIPWYSKASEEGWWDDQDLVRYCLDNSYVGEMFSAVFCDESQDFTRVELDFIMKISSFANRKIDNEQDVSKLPFVFAGDEFQTLNPTGFSWSSLRGYFAKHLCELVHLNMEDNNLHLEDPKELSENFRSTRQVVKLANRVQLLRASRFGEDSKPQSTHFPKDGSPIVCLNPDDIHVFEQLRKKDVVLIVPSADGESIEEFIQNSPLKDKIQFEEGAPVGITILNPTQAKGLEYPNVAIYGFDCSDQYADLNINKLRNWYLNGSENRASKESDIDLKYQISNAYVAVTRAGTKLFIIDKFNDTSFWSFAFNYTEPKDELLIKDVEERMLGALSPTKRQQWNTDDLGWISQGSIDDITAENIDYMKKEENMNSLEKRAEALMDIGLMRQAASRHKEAGRHNDENRCRAKAYMYEENYIKAAEYFAEAELYIDSVNNYWNGLNDLLNNKTTDSSINIEDIITKIARLSTSLPNNTKANLCTLLNKKPSLRNFVNTLADVCTYIEENEMEQGNGIVWETILNLIIPKLTYPGSDANAMEVVLTKRNELKQYKIVLETKTLATMAYNWGLKEHAIKLWDEMDSKAVRPAEYYKAKVEALPYPKNLEYMRQAGDEDWALKVVEAYQQNPEIPLVDTQKLVLCAAIRLTQSEDEFKKFLPFMLRSANSAEAANLILEEATKNIGMNHLNQEVMTAVVYAKFTDLATWSVPQTKYADGRARELLDAMAYIKKVRNNDAVGKSLGAQRPSRELKNFCNSTMKRFEQRGFAPMLYIEVGKAVERRNNFVEIRNYYQAVRSMHNHAIFQREADLRTLYALEQLAIQLKDDKSEMEADQLRQELKLGFDSPLAQSPVVSSWDWETLFAYALNISGELAMDRDKSEKNMPKDTKREEEIVSKEETMAEDKHGSDNTAPRSSSKQSFQFGDFAISYAPSKNEVVIRYQKGDEDITAKIKRGKFVADEEECQLVNNRLIMYLQDDELKTPFTLTLSEHKQVIDIYDGENPTGMSFTFDE